MIFALLFAILMLFWAFFGLFGTRAGASPDPNRPFYGNLMLFVLLPLLGWAVLVHFGPLVHC